MATAAVRIPTSTLDEARRFAALNGDTPGGVLARAWAEFWETHHEELARQFEATARLIRSGDTEGLMQLTAADRADRAREAAQRVRDLAPQLEEVTEPVPA